MTNGLTCRYAVALGCTTPARLAREWKITNREAADILSRAFRAKYIHRAGRGAYRATLPAWEMQ